MSPLCPLLCPRVSSRALCTTSSPLASSRALCTASSVGASFASIVHSLRSARCFRALRGDELAQLELDVAEALALAQRAPSAFNLQPYKAVVVRDALVRDQLAHAMLGGNIGKVQHAAVSVVWLADLQPRKRLRAVARLENADPAALADAEFVFGREDAGEEDARKWGNVGKEIAHAMEMRVKKAAMEALSKVTQAPAVNVSAEAWAFKNTMLAAQTYLLAMTAMGYSSCPMEGFDERRVKEVVAAPEERYGVPVVISSGFEEKREGEETPARPRFEFEEMFCKDSFNFPLYKPK